MNRHFLLVLLLMPLAAISQTSGPGPSSAQADWEAVLVLEAGPQQAEIHSREEARTVTLAHLAKQETALRDFLRKNPQSDHVVDAQLRLARLFATRSDLTGKTAEFNYALHFLTEARKTAPPDRQADLDFAKVALIMRRVAVPTDKDRDALEAQMNAFLARYPNDRRAGALMAEVATLFDSQPRRKGEILKQALAAARTPELRARIEDDLKRLSYLGRPIDVRGTTAEGANVDLSQFRGKVVLLYFFATWSAPSIAGLEEVEYLHKTFASEPVELIGVSLDRTPEALDATIKSHNVSWPVIFDGKSWASPLIRSLCINALPTLWIVDRKGNLRTLNAKTDSEALVRELLKER